MQIATWLQHHGTFQSLDVEDSNSGMAPTAISFCDGSLAGGSFASPDRVMGESPNEDAAAAIAVSNQRGILAVADGMGGHQCGDRASRAVIESIASACESAGVATTGESRESINLRSLLIDAIENANREIVEWGIGAGTTLVAAIIERGSDQATTLRTIHVGDSGALVCGARGKLKHFAVAHAPVAQAVELGLIDEQEALLHEDRSIISNCLGARDMRVELGPVIRLKPRDTVLLASDGLFDNLTCAEIVETVRCGPLSEKIQVLFERTAAKMESDQGKKDDLTVLAFRAAGKGR